jgi:mono/diheme cytochrome c family protein
MVHLTQDARVRVPSAARNGLKAWSAALLTAALVLLAYSEISSAQEPELGIQPNQAETTTPDVANGQAIAGKLCIGCHVIGQTSDGVTTAVDVPSFQSIANRPAQSVDNLSNWLRAPHAPMPDPHLTRKEIRDLAGYIVSRRTRPE